MKVITKYRELTFEQLQAAHGRHPAVTAESWKRLLESSRGLTVEAVPIPGKLCGWCGGQKFDIVGHKDWYGCPVLLELD